MPPIKLIQSDRQLTTPLVSARDAADLLGVSEATLATWRSTGRYPLSYVKCGSLVRYRLGDIEDFLRARTRLHASP
jgi:predicted DNA-binding transcriptional regulator AlpA